MAGKTPFMIKVPVFDLDAGTGLRGLMLSCKDDGIGPDVTALLYKSDGTAIQLKMDRARARQASIRGPFVVLRELDGASQDATLHVSPIIGPDGLPLTSS